MAYGTVNADTLVTSTSGGILGAGNASIMKNRIINGAMVVSQRNGTSSVATADSAYNLDRWKVSSSTSATVTVAQSTTAPTGFANSMLYTVSSGSATTSGQFFGFRQNIEGYNIADLGFGTASAKTVTVSFWVRCSLTGTYAVTLVNSDESQKYPTSFTVNTANTWEQKTITVAGSTTATWLTTNGIGLGLQIYPSLGSSYQGTANAWTASSIYGPTGLADFVATTSNTFYITGVQLEVGSSATGFEYRIYSTELQNCQRYFEKSYNQNEAVGASGVTAFRVSVVGFAGNEYATSSYFKVSKRTAPTMAYYTNGGAANSWVALPAAASRTPVTNSVGENSFEVYVVGVTTDSTLQGSWTASAEL